ncbi:MAG TPA: SRPBCC family protein [Jatrophihabitans sp.]
MTTRGSLERIGDRWRLRFRRELRHDPDRVWRALTSTDELAAWFPDGIRGEWQVGARLTFGSDHVGEFHGEVLRVEPPRVLEYTWGPDVLRWEIEPTAAGSVLTLLDTFVEQGKAARDGAGWHVCLDALEAHLDDAQPAADPSTVWTSVHPEYVSDFGPEASSIGPPG